MNQDIQKHLIEEYEKNGQSLIPEVAVVCEAVSDKSYVYKDFLLDAPSLDASKEFAEYVVLPYRYVKQAKTMDVAYDNFVREIFDYDDDYKKSIENEYKKKGERPKSVEVSGIQIPVLYKNKDLPYEKQVDQIIEDALELYEIIEQSLIDEKKNKAFSNEKEEKIVKKVKLDFYNKHKKEIAGVAAGLALLGMFTFGGNKENKQRPEKIAQNTIENLKANEKSDNAEKTIHFSEVQKTEKIEKKAQEVRAKLADKKENKSEDKKVEQKKQESRKEIAKVEAQKIEPLQVSQVKVPEITLQNISAHLEINKQNRFEKIVAETFDKEGGYGTTAKEAKALRAKGEKVAVIDQPTNFGVTNPLLKSLKKKFPEKYGDLPNDVKYLTQEDGVRVVDYFYQEFNSHKIENESVAKMLLDASYNHEPKTFKKFMERGIKEVEKNRDEKASKKSINNWAGKVNYLNSCSNKELKVFYDKFAEERLAFMKDGRVKKFGGIITRAESYVGEFKVDKDLKQAISVEHAEKIVENKYGISAKTFAMFTQKGKTNS